MMKLNSFVKVLAILVLGISSAPAQTNFYWTNTVDGIWSDANNWTNAAPASATNSILNFANEGATYNATNDLGSFLLNQILFNNAAVSIYGSNLIFISNGASTPQLQQNGASNVTINTAIVQSNNTTYAGTGTGNVTLAGAISGPGSLTKNGADYTLILSGSNTYTGATILNSGTITVNNTTGSGIGRGALTVNGGATLNLSGAISNAAVTTIVGNTAGLATFNMTGGSFYTTNGSFIVGNTSGATGIVTITGGSFTNIMNGATGLLVGNASGSVGTMTFSGNTTTGIFSYLYVGSNGRGTFVVSNGAYVAQSSLADRVTIGDSGQGTLTVDGGTFVSRTGNNFRFGGLGTGVLNITNSGLVVNTTSLMELGMRGGATPNFTHDGTGIVYQSSGTFSNLQALYFGASTNAVGTYNLSGGSYIGNGAVILGQYLGGQGTLNVSGGTFDASGATMTLASATNSVGFLNLTDGVVKVLGISMIGGTSTNANATLLVSGGTLLVGTGGITAGNTAGSQTNIFLSGGTIGTLGAWTSGLTLTLTNNPGPGNVTFNTSGGTITLNGILSGPGGFTKDGAGLLILSATNTYTGVTTISNGILRIAVYSPLSINSLGTNNLVINGGVLELNNIGNPSPTFIRALGAGTNQFQITGGVSGFSGFGNNTEIRINNNTATVIKWGTNFFNPSVFVLNAATANKPLTFNNVLDLNGTNRAIDVYNIQNANNQFSILAQAVTNSAGTTAGLIKGGPGVLQLSSAANSYNGSTIVTGGVLHINTPGALPTTGNLVLSNGVLQQAYGNFTYILGTNANQLQLLPGFSGFSAYGGTRTVMLNGNTNTIVWGQDINPTVLVLNEFSAANGNLIFANGLDLNGTNRTIAVGHATYNGIITGPVTNSTGTAGLTIARTAISAGALVVLANNFMYNGSTIVSNGATLQLGDYWAANPDLPGINGNAGNLNNTGTVIFANAGDVTLTGAILGGNGAVTKRSRGTLTLTGSNTYTGTTTINAGIITLDFAASSTGTNIISSGSALSVGGLGLGGGVLVLNGAAGITNSQTFNGLNAVNAGASAIIVSNGAGGRVNLALNAITRANNNGGVVDFTLPSSGVITTTTSNNFGILGGYATVGGADWATGTGGSPFIIAAYTGYTNVSEGGLIDNFSNTNVKITGNVGLAASTTAINTLAVTNDGGAYTISQLSQTLRLGTTGGILVPAGSGGLTIGSVPNDGYLTAGLSNNVAGELIFINNSSNPITVNSAIISNGTAAVTVTKAGAGAITFNGTNWYGGQTYLNGGLATFTSTNTFSSAGTITIAGGAALVFSATSSNTFSTQINVNNGTLSINGPVTWVAGNSIVAGNAVASRDVIWIGNNVLAGANRGPWLGPNDNSRSASAVFQTNGIVASFAANSFTIGDGINNYGYYGISGGVMTGSEIHVGYRGIGILDVSGTGVVAPTNLLRIVNNPGGIGQINVYPGGTVNTPSANTGNGIQMNLSSYSFSTAYLNLLGGTVNASVGGPSKGLDLMNQAGNTGIVNLVSGTLIAGQIKVSQTIGQSIFNFNGGTLTVADNTTLGTTFMTGLAAAYVHSDGALINTGTNIVTIGQSLRAPTGYGLSSISTVNPIGDQYIAQPFVMITGGSGTGAVAIAELNYASGSITNFRVVNPGSGYASNDVLTVTLLGGGPLSAASVFTVTNLVAATSGGLTKYGAGTLILSTNSTYTGGTVISNGKLQIGNGGSAGSASVLGGIVDNAALVYSFNALSTGNLTIGNVISGNGSVTFIGGNVNDSNYILLTNANSHVGGTFITSGAVHIQDQDALGTGGITVSNSLLSLAANSLAVTNTITLTTGTLKAAGTASDTSYTGPIILTTGTTNTFAAASDFSVVGNISGGGLLLKTNAGILTLTGSNTYTGGTTINAGTIALSGGDNRLLNTSALTFNGNNTILNVGTTSQTLSNLNFPNNLTQTNTIQGSGALIINGNTSLNLGQTNVANSVTLNMAGLNNFTYSGGGNTFRVGLAVGATGTGGNLTPVATVTLASNNLITAAALLIGDQTANGGGGLSTLHLGQSNTLNVATIGIAANGRSSGVLDFAGGLTAPTAKIRGTDGVSPVGTWTVGSVNNFAAGAWYATNDFSAGTVDATVDNLVIGVANGAGVRFGTEIGVFTMGAGQLVATNITVGQVVAGSTVSNMYGVGTFNLVSNGTVQVTTLKISDNNITGSGSAPSASTGTVNLVSGTLKAGTIQHGAGADPALFNWTAGTIQNYNSATDLVVTNLTLNLLPGADHTFQIDNSRTATVSAVLTNTGNLVKTGLGLLNLTATNTYSGLTLVQAGTLAINGYLPSSAVTVTSAGTLAGTGTIDQTVTVDGGTLSPGNSVGTLTVGNLTLTNGVKLVFELGATNASDKVIVNNALSLDGMNTNWFVLSAVGGFGVGEYTLFDATSIIGSLGSETNFANIDGYTGYLWLDTGANDVKLTVVPEPGTGTLVGAGLLAMFLLGRWRRR